MKQLKVSFGIAKYPGCLVEIIRSNSLLILIGWN